MNKCKCGCGQLCKGFYVSGPHARRVRKRFKKKYTGFKIKGKRSVCWLWLLAKDKDGYGTTQIAGKFRRAHTVMYEKEYGKIPDDLQLDHLCKTKACCRPLHVEPVTSKENTRRQPRTKVTPKMVRHVKKLYGPLMPKGKGRPHSRWNMEKLGNKFGVGILVVYKILHGVFDDWKGVPKQWVYQ
jgi:HNH endonuclease